jgi:RibD C-terminal domain
VFVLTHHPRATLEMEGGTTFHFVTDGIKAALDRARQAAGNQDVVLGGGASVVQQYLAAGLVDEFELAIVPILLGDGTRLLENLGDLRIEQVRAIEAPGVTHVKYRVLRRHAAPGRSSAVRPSASTPRPGTNSPPPSAPGGARGDSSRSSPPRSPPTPGSPPGTGAMNAYGTSYGPESAVHVAPSAGVTLFRRHRETILGAF